MLKRRIVRYFLLVITILFAMSSMVSCYGENDLEDFFAEYDIAIDPSVAIFGNFKETITINGVVYDLDTLTYDARSRYFECGFVCGDNLYLAKQNWFVAEEREHSLAMFQIYEYNLLTGETRIFDWAEVVWDSSLPEFHSPIFYFQDRNMVVNDGINATKFNIDTYVIETVPASEYPKKIFVEYTDDKHITIITETLEKEISVDYMAERHELVKELTKLDSFMNAWERKHPVDYFFQEVYTNFSPDGKIYLKCLVYDKTMDPITLVFTYDIETDEFEYVYNNFIDCHGITVYPVFEPVNNDN